MTAFSLTRDAPETLRTVQYTQLALHAINNSFAVSSPEPEPSTSSTTTKKKNVSQKMYKKAARLEKQVFIDPKPFQQLEIAAPDTYETAHSSSLRILTKQRELLEVCQAFHIFYIYLLSLMSIA